MNEDDVIFLERISQIFYLFQPNGVLLLSECRNPRTDLLHFADCQNTEIIRLISQEFDPIINLRFVFEFQLELPFLGEERKKLLTTHIDF